MEIERKFLKQHFQELLDIGIEIRTLEEKDGWSYLMAHSDCIFTKWNSENLNFNQLIKLETIVTDYISISSCDEYFLKVLRFKIKSIKEQLLELNYCEKWLEYRILTILKLEEQISLYQKGEDLNTEHYRYSTFKNYIKNINEFKDSQIKNLIEIMSIDSDKTMAGSALVELLRKNKITDNQFNNIKKEVSNFGDWTNKVIERQIQKRIKTGYNKV